MAAITICSDFGAQKNKVSHCFPIYLLWSDGNRCHDLIPAILIPACASSSLAFLVMYSAYKLKKQGDKIQPWCTPFPIWNQFVVPCLVLTASSWPEYSFLRRQVRWSGIPISKNFPQFAVIHTVKGFGVVNKAEVDVFLELSCFFDNPCMFAISSLVPLPFLYPAWTSESSWLRYCWSLAWRILNITLLVCEMNAKCLNFSSNSGKCFIICIIKHITEKKKGWVDII